MIETRTRIVFYSSAANRHYFSKAAAIQAEAKALLIAKHPIDFMQSRGYLL